jgi:hypothetical protein
MLIKKKCETRDIQNLKKKTKKKPTKKLNQGKKPKGKRKSIK